MRQGKKRTVDDCSRIYGPVVITRKCIFQFFAPFFLNNTVKIQFIYLSIVKPITGDRNDNLTFLHISKPRRPPFPPAIYRVVARSTSLPAPVTTATLALVPVIPITIIIGGHILPRHLSTLCPIQSPILPLCFLRLARLLPPLHLRFARRSGLRLAHALGGLQVLELLGEAFAGQGAVLHAGARGLAFYDGVGGEVLQLDGRGGFVLYFLIFGLLNLAGKRVRETYDFLPAGSTAVYEGLVDFFLGDYWSRGISGGRGRGSRGGAEAFC